MIAGTLEVQMLANLARLADDMGKAKSMVGSTMKDIEGAVASAKSALGALGIGLSVGYFVSLIKGAIDAQDHLNDLSKTTGIAVEQLSGLKLAAKQSGGDLDSIAASINKLSVEMGKSPEKFRALGVSAKDPLEAFKQLSDVFVRIQDPQQRAAVAAVALGKSWAGAAPLLAEGGAKIQELVDRGSKLSGVTKESAAKADELNDRWQELVGTGGLVNGIVSTMLDPLLRLTNQMIAAKDASSGFIETLARFFSISGSQAADPVAALSVVNDKLAALRKTSEEFASMGVFGRIFSADDIAIVKGQIAFLEAQKQMLEAMQKASVASPTKVTGPAPAPGAIGAFVGVSNDAEIKKQVLAAQQIMDFLDEQNREIFAQIQEVEAAEKASYDSRNTALIDFYDREQEQAIRHGEELLAIDKAIADQKKADQAAQLAGAMMFLGNLASLMNTHSKKAFELGKIASMSSAAVKGALAVMDAWEAGMSVGGPYAPVVAAVYAAAAAANALNLINNIRKQTFGGGGGAPIAPTQGSSGISPVGLGGGSMSGPSSQTVVNVNITGVVTSEVLDQLKDQLTQFFGNDGVLINASSRQASVIATGI